MKLNVEMNKTYSGSKMAWSSWKVLKPETIDEVVAIILIARKNVQI